MSDVLVSQMTRGELVSMLATITSAQITFVFFTVVLSEVLCKMVSALWRKYKNKNQEV